MKSFINYYNLLLEANADKRIDYLTNKYGEKLINHLTKMGLWDYPVRNAVGGGRLNYSIHS